LCLPCHIGWFKLRAWANTRRAGERFGIVPPRLASYWANQNCIWIHAVSVGEVLAVSADHYCCNRDLVKGMADRDLNHDGNRTELAREKFGEAMSLFSNRLRICASSIFFAVLPAAGGLGETEFWPNFLQLSQSSGARVGGGECPISTAPSLDTKPSANLLNVFCAT